MTRKRCGLRYNCLRSAPGQGLFLRFSPRTPRMTEASLAFSNRDQILLLFGAQDRYLRQVRDAVGVDVTLRGDEIRLHGTDEQIRRGLAVFAELRAIVERQGQLLDSEVQGVLGTAQE